MWSIPRSALRRRASPAVRSRPASLGLALWTVSYLGWLPAVGLLAPATQHPPRPTAVMVAGHVVWGAAAGLALAALLRR